MFWNKKPSPISELIEVLNCEPAIVFIENKSDKGFKEFISRYTQEITKFNNLINVEKTIITYHWDRDVSSVITVESKTKTPHSIAVIFYEDNYHSNYVDYPERDDTHSYPFLLLPMGEYFKKSLMYKEKYCSSVFSEVFSYFKSKSESSNIENFFIVSNDSVDEIKSICKTHPRAFYLKIQDNKIVLTSFNKKVTYSFE